MQGAILIQVKTFETADDFFDFISPWGNDPELSGFIFRGHSQESYELTPTALRAELKQQLWRMSGEGKPEGQCDWQFWQIHAEYHLLRAFYRLADQRGLEVPASVRVRQNLAQEFDTVDLIRHDQQDVWIPSDLHETAALAQHYGVPTRLLDWTYDIYVSAYFAFRGAIEKKGNLAIWALNKEYISSLKPTVDSINVEFITPHYSQNPNLNAQKGLFTLWPELRDSKYNHARNFFEGTLPALVDRRPLDQLIADNNDLRQHPQIFKKFIIPCSEAKRACMILDKLGYESSRIFPGYDGVATQLQERHKYL
ncbi:hypothetical protein DMX01_03290 [Pseudomonas fulva]|nr:hypothetical protein DMX01_03290 [Pseudomonas fulva]PYC16390.1 hypothetical protein DMX00_04880 [Pseudomonas fulva]